MGEEKMELERLQRDEDDNGEEEESKEKRDPELEEPEEEVADLEEPDEEVADEKDPGKFFGEEKMELEGMQGDESAGDDNEAKRWCSLCFHEKTWALNGEEESQSPLNVDLETEEP